MPDLNEQMRADFMAVPEFAALDMDWNVSIQSFTNPATDLRWAGYKAARRQHGSAAQAVAHAWFHRGMVNFDSEEALAALAALDDGKGTPIPLFAAAGERHRAIGAAIERACKELPLNFEVQVMLERDAGTVTLYYPEGQECDDQFDADTFDEQITNAIDAAMKAGAQGGGNV